MIRFGAWLAAACLAAGVASAHTRSQSHSVWEVNGRDVSLIMTIPTIEADRLSADGTSPSDEEVKRYLTARVYALAAGKRCELVPPVETLASAPGFRKYDFTFKCASPE